eukprot:GSChrysophyteH1.ASY1.ANO1.2691.1 assembled CDS
MARREELQKLKDSKKAPKPPEKETTSALKTHVKEVMSGKNNGATKMHRKLLKQRKEKQQGLVAGTRKAEQQGPIDWSTNGLKCKYRGEMEREAAWRSWETANAYSKDALDSQDIVIPIAKLERHPLFVQFYDHIKAENNGSCLRTRSRLLMKRFVFDVHEVWLTNLQHLREHQPARLMAVDPTLPPGTNRRDQRAIESMEAQIQSVSTKRSLKNAYYTTHMPETKTVLNFIPAETPDPIVPRALPPTLESLVDGLYVKTIDAETSVDPNNKLVGIPEISIFVERLLPPSDHKAPEIGQIHDQVLWRFSAYRREDVSMLYYVTTEKEIIQFKKQLDELDLEAETEMKSDDQGNQGSIQDLAFADASKAAEEMGRNAPSTGQIEYAKLKLNPSLREIYVHDEDFDIPWAVMDLGATIHFYIGRKGGDLGNIQVKVVANLLGDYDGDQLVATVSPIELRYILKNPTIPLNDLEWWSHPSRQSDVWKSLLGALYVKDGDTNEYGDPEPQILCFAGEKTAADRVPGALTTGSALATAQEVLCAVRVDSKCRLHLQGGNPRMFMNTDDIERRFKEMHLDNEDDRTHVSQFMERKIVIDHDNDPPTNIGSLQDKLALIKFEEELRAEKKSNAAEGASISDSMSQMSGSIQEGEGVEESKQSVNAERSQLDKGMSQETMNELLRIGSWDKVLDDRCSTLSMITSNALQNVAQIPGSCEMGRMGLWFPHLMYREYTQACANYFRDPKVSTTDSVLVNMTLSLDTALQFPTILAWEDFSQLPPKCVAEEIDGVVPSLLAKPGTLCQEALISPIDERPSELAGVFSTIPETGTDHVPLDTANIPKGMMRQWPFVAKKSFRKKIVQRLLGVDPVLPTVVFGITRYGAQPNVPGVNSRNIWHSTLAITEHINRPRASKDYHYYLENKQTQGANDPTSFTTTMKAGECVGLSSSAFRVFEKDYEEIKLRREIFARQLALDTKIENSVIAMKTKEASLKAEMQKELQMKIEKKMRKATKSEKGWSKRFFTSQLLEVQHNWERRLDEKSGTVFFRAITPASSVTGAWDQPPDSWHPGMDNIKPTTSEGKTYGNKAEVALGNRVKDHQLPAHALNQSNSQTRTVGFDESSVLAERSMGESAAATIDTANLEHIAEQLVSSDELMRVLARRLGLPEQQIVAAEDLSVFSVSVGSVGSDARNIGNESTSNAENGVINAPRDPNADVEDDEDSDADLWSDEEQQVGDADEDELGDLPQNHYDKNTIRKRKMRAEKEGEISVPGSVPFLNLDKVVEEDEEGEGVSAGWRKLARPDIPEKFFDKCNKPQTLGPGPGSCNTFNQPVFLVPISPVDACQYEPDNFESHIESIFIPDAKKDMERSMATVERNIRREEDLAKNVPTDDLLLFGSAEETTKADQYIAKQYKEDKNAFVDPKEGAIRKALLAAKSNNVAEMEDALEEDISVNVADAFGNTLLILAAQQGSKRMCKFLLRRGANLNLQSLSGNTCLHYCYAYSQFKLAEYLKQKGADDSILNIDKMTCYEGLSAEALKEEGEESEEDEEEN